MSENNKAILRRWFEEVWNRGRTDVIDELLARDAVIHGLQDANGQAVAGFAKGLAPLTAVEIARRSLNSSVQPGAAELETALKALPAIK